MKAEDIQDSIQKSEELSKFVKDCKFHKYNFTVPPDLFGRQIMEKQHEIAIGMNEITSELPRYKYLMRVYDARVKEAMGKATTYVMAQEINKKLTAKEKNQKILFCEITLTLDNKTTRPYDELMRKAAMEYIVDVGEGKLSFGEKMLSYCTTLLSYNKTEINSGDTQRR
jgi:hypothetical protein